MVAGDQQGDEQRDDRQRVHEVESSGGRNGRDTAGELGEMAFSAGRAPATPDHPGQAVADEQRPEPCTEVDMLAERRRRVNPGLIHRGEDDGRRQHEPERRR